MVLKKRRIMAEIYQVVPVYDVFIAYKVENNIGELNDFLNKYGYFAIFINYD